MAPATKRKLIDIKHPVIQILSLEAEKNAGNLEVSPNIRRLIGSAKPVKDLTEIEDDRLQYILSK